MDPTQLEEFAARYTAAWCSHDPASVASFFEDTGSLTINGAAPSVGRSAIATAASAFMSAFPDLVVRMDSVSQHGNRIVYEWTLTGTNTGPGGGGGRVQISGYEEWRFGDDGLIAESLGYFDQADYQRQIDAGHAM